MHQDVLIHQVLELLFVKVIFRLYDEDGNAKVTKKEVRNIQCESYSETLTQQVGRIHRLLAEPTVCERLGQCVEAVGKQVDTIDLDRWHFLGGFFDDNGDYIVGGDDGGDDGGDSVGDGVDSGDDVGGDGYGGQCVEAVGKQVDTIDLDR